MPGRDGTGPQGQGAMTGRGFGIAATGQGRGMGRRQNCLGGAGRGLGQGRKGGQAMGRMGQGFGFSGARLGAPEMNTKDQPAGADLSRKDVRRSQNYRMMNK